MQHKLKKIKQALFNSSVLPSKTSSLMTERELKIAEGKIGAAIFGPLAPNEHRVFFNDNRDSWFFYQEKTDLAKNKHSVTLHYEVRPEGVVRISNQNGMKCELITGQELKNFIDATEIYYSQVMDKIYKSPVERNSQLAA